jgi:TusA-related sulfurtransferase
MTSAFLELDVRPTLRNGGEPFQEIMQAIASLVPGQGLKLYATFKPVPLFSVLKSKGFSNEARELDNGDWEVLFLPTEGASDTGQTAPAAAPAPANGAEWPAPVQELDNRDLDPPEPMVRTLAATEAMQDGEVLCALLCREPVFLLPELAKRGHAWRGAFEPDGTTYKILIRIGAADKEAA